jgi:hypothetical protein
MKPPSTFQFFFLLALTTPSVFSLPIVVARPADEYTQSKVYRPNFRYIISLWESRHGRGHGPSISTQSIPQEPHFPPHQLQQSREGDSNDDSNGIVKQPKIETTIIQHSHDPSLRSAALAAILKAAEGRRVQATAGKESDGSPTSTTRPKDELIVLTSVAAAPTSWLERLREEDAKRYGHSAGAKEAANRAAGAMHGERRCDGRLRHGRMESVSAEGGNGGEIEKVAYTYKLSFVKQNYTDILVVGIVVLFFVAVVLVEVLEKVVGT